MNHAAMLPSGRESVTGSTQVAERDEQAALYP